MTSDLKRSMAELIRESMPQFRPVELRVARALLSDYPSAALSTASDLAAMASSSTASVVRFCSRLGLSGFGELQSRLREELSLSSASPRSRLVADAPSGTEFAAAIQRRADLVLSAVSSVPDSEWVKLVDLLADTKRTALLAGGTLSHLAARYLQLQLRHIRPRVHYLDDALRLDIGSLLDAKKDDVIVLFDFRRYDENTARIADIAKTRGLRLVLFTDTWLSPIARRADIVIPLHVEASFLDSFAAVYAVIETMVPAIAAKIGPAATVRMETLESARVGDDRTEQNGPGHHAGFRSSAAGDAVATLSTDGLHATTRPAAWSGSLVE